MESLRYYARMTGASIRSQMQYPTSFLMLALAHFLSTFMEIFGVWALFSRFGQVQGWKLGEVCLFYGVVNVAFSLAEAGARGFDVFGEQLVKTGAFDRMLLRPRPTALQLAAYELRLSRIGRFAQGLIVIAAGYQLLHLPLTAGGLGLLLLAVSGGAALFTGILILQATMSFWTVESLEIVNTLTYGGVEAGQYPLSLYARWFRAFLIFIVPIGCVAYFPVVGVLGRPDPLGAPAWFLPVAPLVGFVFLGFSLWVWRFGVRHYTSTGS